MTAELWYKRPAVAVQSRVPPAGHLCPGALCRLEKIFLLSVSGSYCSRSPTCFLPNSFRRCYSPVNLLHFQLHLCLIPGGLTQPIPYLDFGFSL